MRRFILVFSILALLASAVIYFSGVVVSRDTGLQLHYFGVPQVEIDRIKLEVVYFVPHDREPDEHFLDRLRPELAEVQRFHTREFRGTSALRYSLYPYPVIGNELSEFYDGNDTAWGNQGALMRIFSETAERVWRVEGDLHDAQFSKRKEGELPIRVFVYQGVGATSGVLSALVAYDYFATTSYGAATLYHELMHNFGVPDAYDHETGVSQAEDIMGAGRTRPLSETFVRDEIKRNMIQ